VPLTSFQSEVLRLLAAQRSLDSYDAGATPLHRQDGRFSEDIDIFHDREERVAEAARLDAAVLLEAGLDVAWLRRQPAIYSAAVSRRHPSGDERTHLEWVADSDFRFFPTVPDPLFGYMLHPVDLATNKAMAAAGRQKPADAVDLLAIHERILSLGAVIWATVDKAPGYTPEGLIAEIRRNAMRIREEDLRAVRVEQPMAFQEFHAGLRTILVEAEAFVVRMPTDKAGLLFLRAGRIVQPDPERLGQYDTHACQRRGHWPSNTEITTAMLERYRSSSR